MVKKIGKLNSFEDTITHATSHRCVKVPINFRNVLLDLDFILPIEK